MNNSEVIETPLLKNPFECLKRAATKRKNVIDGVLQIFSSIKKLQLESLADSQSQVYIVGLAQALEDLKEQSYKLQQINQTENEYSNKVCARLKHLKEAGSPQVGQFIEWNKHRMDRILVDYLLRNEYIDAAKLLTKEQHIEELVDISVFDTAQKIVEALKDRDCKPAIDWCMEHRARLKKFKSSLEFELRQQEFVELVKQSQFLSAVGYAKQYLSPWANEYMESLQRVMAVLAFTGKTQFERYRVFFEDNKWDSLLRHFYEDLYQLYNLPTQPLLSLHLQAGLSALKVHNDYSQKGLALSRDDPMHLDSFQSLAKDLPMAKHTHSKLICKITKEFMNDDNPAKVLPNGYVYSQKGIELLASQSSNNTITCPSTGEVYSNDENDIRRIFIL